MAERLRRATEETAGEAVEDFVAFWRADGRRHFRAEEEVLLPCSPGTATPATTR